MYIPEYFDIMNIKIIGSNGLALRFIRGYRSFELHLHTLKSVEEYVENEYITTCKLISMEWHTRTVQFKESEEFIIANITIQLD